MELNILTREDTISYILKNKCSIARFGDGEIDLMIGISIGFQEKNKNLRDCLREVHTTDKCLVCIPYVFDKSFFNKEVFKPSAYKFWRKHLFRRKRYYKKYFMKNSVMGNTFITRFYMDFINPIDVKGHVKNLKKLWNKRDVIFVEGEKTRLGIGNDLFDNANSIRRILCPATDAFNKYDEIVSAIKEVAKKDDLIICALGPTATILAYNLSNEYQVFDLGHIDIEYEWFLRSAKEKIPIENKYVNECVKTGRNPEDCTDKTYLSQIVKKVK